MVGLRLLGFIDISSRTEFIHLLLSFLNFCLLLVPTLFKILNTAKAQFLSNFQPIASISARHRVGQLGCFFWFVALDADIYEACVAFWLQIELLFEKRNRL